MTVEKKVVVKNKQGLHARPAALFVQIANKFTSNITITKGKQEVNGKSIMGIMMLAAGRGSRLVIKADGEDAEDAVLELEDLLSGKLDKKE
jgi:phosphocarrier protein HPr